MSAVAEAELRIKSNLTARRLSLEGLGLQSLAPLLPHLARMKALTSFSVADNRLTELPVDLGAATPALTTLDLGGNPVPAVRTVLMGLRGLPALRDLRVDLPLETEEDQLIVALPDLERFNGTSLVDDLPPAAGEADRVEEEDAEAPPLPPRASSTGAVGGNSGGRSGEGPRATYWTSTNSAAVETLFAQVTEASDNVTRPQEFFDYLGRVVKHVTCLTAADDDPLCQEGEVLKARRLLFQYCFEELAKTLEAKDPAVAQGLHALVQFSSLLLDDYDTHWRRIFRDRDARLTLMKRDMKGAIKQIESLMIQVANGGASADATADADELSTPAVERGLGAGAAGGAGPCREYLRDNIGREREVASAPQRSSEPPARPQPQPQPQPQQQVPSMLPVNHRTPVRAVTAPSAQSASGTAAAAAAASASGARGRSRAGAEAGEHSNGKVLTLKQLKDTIDDIYVSKTKYDAKCKESGLPRETMEQHMYTYLNQRYGLREIIQDWATAIAHGIKRFAADDNDAAVFGKILRNDIDEEFRYVQRQVRDTVRELVRAQIKARRPLKSELDINSQLEKKMAGMLNENEWGDVVRYMYNKQDAATLIALVRKTIFQQTMPGRVRRQGRQPVPAAAPTADERQIPYKDLVHLLLDFQLEGHERFLAAYVAIFRHFDRDGNGIVNSEEFKAIVLAVDADKIPDEAEAMANLIDPFGSQLITFSETVTFLSDELLKMSRDANTAVEQ